MAPTPSTIPTSFVPKAPVSTGSNPRFSKTGGNTFLIISLVILGLSVAASIGVFAYERYLMGVREAKAEAVRKEQEAVESEAISEFVRMRDRLNHATAILDSHVVASGFFKLLEEVTLQSVRFDSLSLAMLDDGTAEIQMSGVARTFNALASQSSVLAGERLMKRAIFSDIAVNEENETVTFSLEAELDPKILEFTAESLATAPIAPPESESDVAPPEEGGASAPTP